MITLDWKTIQQLETHLVDFKLVKNVYKLIYKPFYESGRARNRRVEVWVL